MVAMVNNAAQPWWQPARVMRRVRCAVGGGIRAISRQWDKQVRPAECAASRCLRRIDSWCFVVVARSRRSRMQVLLVWRASAWKQPSRSPSHSLTQDSVLLCLPSAAPHPTRRAVCPMGPGNERGRSVARSCGECTRSGGWWCRYVEVVCTERWQMEAPGRWSRTAEAQALVRDGLVQCS